mmetsp:Transcript_41458/g.88436  ORF Transcript_41458/g.88436 Transcript_41458/m.88436 type:complete len:234 (-) Transcript_41458:139-840(-)
MTISSDEWRRRVQTAEAQLRQDWHTRCQALTTSACATAVTVPEDLVPTGQEARGSRGSEDGLHSASAACGHGSARPVRHDLRNVEFPSAGRKPVAQLESVEPLDLPPPPALPPPMPPHKPALGGIRRADIFAEEEGVIGKRAAQHEGRSQASTPTASTALFLRGGDGASDHDPVDDLFSPTTSRKVGVCADDTARLDDDTSEPGPLDDLLAPRNSKSFAAHPRTTLFGEPGAP